MDPSLLHQVVWNLCQNAMQHSTQEPQAIRIKLIAGRSDTSRVPTLDILDNGSGIADDLSDTMFEPFFTTKSSGTGLGLYIAREICESSEAHLDYLPPDGEGCRFRITFPDTEGLSVSAFA